MGNEMNENENQGFPQGGNAWPSHPPVAQNPVVDSGSAFGYAITSMVLGIVWVYWVTSILALIFGHLALKKMKQDNNFRGKGFAIAGVALGWTWIGILGVGIIIGVIAAIASS